MQHLFKNFNGRAASARTIGVSVNFSGNSPVNSSAIAALPRATASDNALSLSRRTALGYVLSGLLYLIAMITRRLNRFDFDSMRFRAVLVNYGHASNVAVSPCRVSRWIEVYRKIIAVQCGIIKKFYIRKYRKDSNHMQPWCNPSVFVNNFAPNRPRHRRMFCIGKC